MMEEFLLMNIFERYCEFVHKNEKSPNTRNSYISDVKLFWNYFEGNLEIKKSDLIRFLNIRKSDKSWNRMLSSLKAFNKFLLKNINNNSLSFITSIKSKTLEDKPVKILSSNQILRIFSYAILPGGILAARNSLLLEFLYSLALDPKEVALIRLEDIDFQNRKIYISERKDFLPLLNTHIDKLKNLISYNPNITWLFYSHKTKQPLNRKSIWRIVNNIAKNANLNINPRILKNSYIASMVNIKKEDIKQFLGHKNLETTKKIILRTGAQIV